MKYDLQTVLAISLCLAAAPVASGQQPTSEPVAPTAVTSQPEPTTDEGLTYEIYELAGKVLVAPIGADPVKDAAQWKPARRGDLLRKGQQLRTTLRSRVKLIARPADPPTVILVEAGTRLTIEDLAIREGTAVSRLGLGYGAVRAGVAEGEVRSDMEIATPSAVLSKRGTDIFKVEYMNGRFNMSLSEQGRGMLQAIQLQFGNRGDVVGFRSRLVTPGQAVTQRMAQAIESMTWDRDVNMSDVFGLVGNDRLLTLLNDRGFGFLLPWNSSAANIFGGPTATDGQQAEGLGSMGGAMLPASQAVRSIQDGDFGVGQSALPSLFGGANRRITPNSRRVPVTSRPR
ncbi:MAG TPA: hypothetical protein VNT79_07530, partial [Phycisphaerae bacterium]|nr:hypothetical protein [Phycisphaerae bacterium]